MTASHAVQIALYGVVLLTAAALLGHYITGIIEGTSPIVRRFGWPIERFLYQLAGIDEAIEMSWQHYAIAVVAFNAFGAFVLYLLLRTQGILLLNPQHFPAITANAAFNTAVSFVTNTNWQNDAGESTLSYLAQMLGLTVQNFLSAATGIAVVIALIRGFARHTAQTIGNFWVDLTRITIYILLPVSIILSVLFISQGVIQNFAPYRTVPTLQAVSDPPLKTDVPSRQLKDSWSQRIPSALSAKTQTLAMGPVAAQEAIKILGTNGGGFFNTNSAHPYENPTPASNFVQMIAMLAIPGALCFVFGQMVGDRRQGLAVLAVMLIVFIAAVVAETFVEQSGNPILASLGADQTANALQPGGNMEGKEARFGIVQSALFTVATTSASCGAVNTMHDSLTPLGGLVPMLLIQLGEVIFGGVGSGLYGMLVFAVLAIFIAGLMVGRTPEYLGKKIETYEMKMVAIVVLLAPLLVLVGTSIAVLAPAGKAGLANPGPHGFSEILYAFSSAANNNGSAFAGLLVNTPFYNWATAIVMWLGRFATIIPILAIAGALAAKKRLVTTAGSMPTHGPLFVTLLLGTVLLVNALTYIPALALGPMTEHLMMTLAKGLI